MSKTDVHYMTKKNKVIARVFVSKKGNLCIEGKLRFAGKRNGHDFYYYKLGNEPIYIITPAGRVYKLLPDESLVSTDLCQIPISLGNLRTLKDKKVQSFLSGFSQPTWGHVFLCKYGYEYSYYRLINQIKKTKMSKTFLKGRGFNSKRELIRELMTKSRTQGLARAMIDEVKELKYLDRYNYLLKYLSKQHLLELHLTADPERLKRYISEEFFSFTNDGNLARFKYRYAQKNLAGAITSSLFSFYEICNAIRFVDSRLKDEWYGLIPIPQNIMKQSCYRDAFKEEDDIYKRDLLRERGYNWGCLRISELTAMVKEVGDARP